ncbi:hypothetical protein ACK30K_11485 [Aeromonas caviae]|uniref:hypothetical protein n=1 Tax=Aeromonas caviae TaxID=648 RepID=UPI00114CA785|nr:hypothetical protein [Aeromonas caviae]MBL0607087.1 hypothetical protein [Aeromonas caviae]
MNYTGWFNKPKPKKKLPERIYGGKQTQLRNARIRLGSNKTLAGLVDVMSWHDHYIYILIVATDHGVTGRELTEKYGLNYVNHRVNFQRLNVDLALLGWHFVSKPRTTQNKPWGWWLQPI